MVFIFALTHSSAYYLPVIINPPRTYAHDEWYIVYVRIVCYINSKAV